MANPKRTAPAIAQLSLKLGESQKRRSVKDIDIVAFFYIMDASLMDDPPMTQATTPQPIETAPKDIVILTNDGIACYVDQRDWGSPVTNGWYLCDYSGDIISCADDGMAVSRIYPKLWMTLPKFS